jgi:hypothetical protein
MAHKIIDLKFSRSTRGTHVYTAETSGAPIETLYIRRDALPAGNPPAHIVVNVTWPDAAPTRGED